MTAILGFEFLINEGKHARWVRIQGGGGLLGDGWLATINADKPNLDERVRRATLMLTRAAQMKLQREGSITICRPEAPLGERFEECCPDEVVSCVPIRDYGKRAVEAAE